MGPIGAGLLIGGISALGGALTSTGQTFFNKAEARKNREFQREMRDTAIISSVNQAEKLGISPSLVLGQGSSNVGGSQATASGTNPLASSVDQLTKVLLQDRQIDAQEQLAHERAEWDLEKAQAYYDHIQEMAKIRNTANTNDGIMKHNYTKKELNSFFDDWKDIQI